MSTAAVLESPVAAARPMSLDALHEVVHGRRVEMPAMSAYSTLIAARLAYRMGPFAEARRLGTVVPEMLFILDPVRDLRRRPDVAFVSANRWALDRMIPETGDWDVIPDLAVEVVSPNESFEELLGKVDEYFQAGVHQVWIVVPAQKKVLIYDSPIRVRILTDTDELDGGPLVPGFRVSVAELFVRQVQPGPEARSSATS